MERKQKKGKIGIYSVRYNGKTVLIEATIKRVHNEDKTFCTEFYDTVRRRIMNEFITIAPKSIVICERALLQVHILPIYDIDDVIAAIDRAIDGCKVEPNKRDKDKQKEYYEKNKEQILEKKRKYNREHYAERQAYKKEWRKRTGKN